MKLLVLLIVSGLLSACTYDPVPVGARPALSPVGEGSGDPYAFSDPRVAARPSTNSLWRDTKAGFFKDRAMIGPGDLVTVLIEIDDQAALDNKSSRSRNGQAGFGLGGAADFNGAASAFSVDFNGKGNSKNAGEGRIARSERIRLRIAALVTDVLPNGTLLVRGQQEVRVNNEMRVLAITGIIRPADVSSDNTIAYDKIAEARVTYGGEGRITEMQQPTFVHQIYDRVSPF